METLTRDELLEKLIPPVKRYARKYADLVKIECEDIEQEALLHLLTSLDSYNGEEINFNTWGANSAKWAAHKLLRQQRYVRLSNYTVVALIHVKRTKEYMAAFTGYDPTVAEVAEEMQVPVKIVKQILQLEKTTSVISLDEPLDDSSKSGTLADLVMDKRSETYPEQRLMCLDLHEQMKNVLATLEPVEEATMRLRYGFINDEDYTQRETADELKISLTDERMVEIKAMRKLRHPSRSRYLEPFLYDF